MEFSVLHGPVFSVLEIHLLEGETVVAQPNSMVSMTSGLQLSANVGHGSQRSSWWSGAKNALGGESFFTAEYKAKRDGQTLMLAPSVDGEILCIELASTTGYYLIRGAYLANIGDCTLKVKYGGVKSLLSKKGLFLMHASGSGTVFCQSHGAMIVKELEADEHFFLDNRYAVAFSDTVTYKLVKATESVRDSIMSGEGFVIRYTGPGKVFYQTRGKPPVNFLGYLFGSAF